MKLELTKGTTSYIAQIFISDSSSTTGAGLAGLVHDSAGLQAYYHRPDEATATQIVLDDTTLGSGFVSGAFKEVDATNMPGWYEFHLPNMCLASGADTVGIQVQGATDMATLPIEIVLKDLDLTDLNTGIAEIKGTGFDTNTNSLKEISNTL